MPDEIADPGQTGDIVQRLFGRDAAARLLAHPGMPEAVRVAATIALRSYDGHWFRNRLLNDRGRFLAALLILDLHFTESGGAGVTGARMRREVTHYGVCSAGRATALLAALRFAKFLSPSPTPGIREKRLVPTPHFLAAHRERWGRMFEAIAHLDPDAAAAARDLPDDLLFGPATHAMVECFREGLRVAETAPELTPFVERDAGLVILITLYSLREEMVTVKGLAAHFSVSRAHVTDMLQGACAVGLARPAGPRGGFVAGPKLQDTLARFYVIIFLTFLRALKATRQTDAGRDISVPLALNPL